MTDETPTNLAEDDALLSSDEGVELSDDQIDAEADEQNAVEDDSEEVEHEGQKHRIPKALKPLLMMQADYTRKTQEVAADRKALEAERAQAATFDRELVGHQAKIISIDERLARFVSATDADWQALREQDPEQYRDLKDQFRDLKDARQQAVGALQHKFTERSLEQQRISAKQVEEGAAVLARDIKDWSPQRAGALNNFAQKEFGFSAAELEAVIDPRVVKVLDRLERAEQALKKQTTAQKVAKQEEVRPTPKVAGQTAPARGLDDRLSADEWTRRRNEQLRARR